MHAMNPNPYLLPVPAGGNSALAIQRRQLEPFIAEHMEGFGDALEGFANTPEKQFQRVRAHQLLRVAGAAAFQAKVAAEGIYSKMSPLGGFSFEAATPTLQADITGFVTQMIHMSLDVFPRLLANNLVSVQPLTQPSGYVFYLYPVATDDSDRRLSTLSTFDKDYTKRTTENTQVKGIGQKLTKTLVEAGYHAVMGTFSHEVDVALRSQYGLNMQDLNLGVMGDELAWEVDRQVIDALVTFAETNPAGIVYFDDTAGGTYDSLAPSEQHAYDQQFVRKTISSVEVDMANTVFVRPNWYLCGANVAKLLARTPHALAQDTRNMNFDQLLAKGSPIQFGTTTTGSRVWLDPQMDADTMVVGHTTSNNPFYAGYVFSPFGLASLLTALFMDPDILMARQARALAFAQVGIRPEQYRVIKLGTGS